MQFNEDNYAVKNPGKIAPGKTGFQDFLQSKKANIAVDPLLTNPLNSATKLQISAT